VLAPFSRKDVGFLYLWGYPFSPALHTLPPARRARVVAGRDSLTSLYNDRYFHRKLQREIERLAGTKEGEVSLLFLDCDHLKRVNDEHGHLAGSQVLREVSFIMQRVLAETVSLACRYGGDEFTVILLDQSLEQAAVVAEKLRRAVSEWVFLPMAIGPGEPALNLKNVLSMSVGVASYRAHCAPGAPPAEQKNQLLKAADAALYMAKTKGKNCVVAAPPGPGGADSVSVILKS